MELPQPPYVSPIVAQYEELVSAKTERNLSPIHSKISESRPNVIEAHWREERRPSNVKYVLRVNRKEGQEPRQVYKGIHREEKEFKAEDKPEESYCWAD